MCRTISCPRSGEKKQSISRVIVESRPTVARREKYDIIFERVDIILSICCPSPNGRQAPNEISGPLKCSSGPNALHGGRLSPIGAARASCLSRSQQLGNHLADVATKRLPRRADRVLERAAEAYDLWVVTAPKVASRERSSNMRRAVNKPASFAIFGGICMERPPGPLRRSDEALLPPDAIMEHPLRSQSSGDPGTLVPNQTPQGLFCNRARPCPAKEPRLCDRLSTRWPRGADQELCFAVAPPSGWVGRGCLSQALHFTPTNQGSARHCLDGKGPSRDAPSPMLAMASTAIFVFPVVAVLEMLLWVWTMVPQ